MKRSIPLSLLSAIAAGNLRRPEKKPRRQFTRCRKCGNRCRTELCFKCEQASP